MRRFLGSKKILFLLMFCLILGAGFVSCSPRPGKFVKKHGHLQVIGPNLCDKSGKSIQLKGMSYLDIEGEQDYVNPEFFVWLRDYWGSNVVRAAMYTEDSGSFVADRKYDQMRKAINYAIETGLYILVDWHILYDGFPAKYQEEALDFFAMMAKEYKGCPNIIYEICNEPNGEDLMWSRDIKSYAIPVIKAIRSEDPDAVIIVGTPEWDQRLDAAIASPLDFDNILYAFHFYSGTHGPEVKQYLEAAIEAELPVFVSEWGTTKSTGDDGVYAKEAMEWIGFINENNLSWCNWSISVRNEDASALKPNTPGKKGWSIYNLTESGTLVRSLILESTEDIFFADGFESESYQSGDWINGGAGMSESEFHSGFYSSRFKKSSTLTKEFSTEVYSDVEVGFFYKTVNFNEGDTFKMEWFGNGKWNAEDSLSASSDKWSEVSVKLPVDVTDGNPDFAVRLVSQFKSDDTNVFMDDFSLKMRRPSLYKDKK